VKIAYGPPGAVGVKSLQYVGDDADYTSTGLRSVAKPVGAIALAVAAYAWKTGDKKLQKQALAVAAGALILKWSSR